MGGVVPDQYLILPDPLLTGDTVIEPLPEQGADYVGPAIPREGNEGDLIPTQEGTPTAVVDLDYLLVRSGGLYEGAEWIWKGDTDDEDDWRGQDDPRWPHEPHDPFDAASGTRTGFGLEVLYSEAFDRILLYKWSGPGPANQSLVRYRDAGASNPTEWTATTQTWERAFQSTQGGVSGCELTDGAMRMVVATGSLASALDLDLYGSTDGGLTWTRLGVDLLDTWHSGGAQAVYNLQLRRSGDWLRISWVDNATDKLQTLVSSDRGATWTELDEVPGTGTILDNGDSVDHLVYAMVGLDDGAGTFIVWTILSTSTADISMLVAARDAQWAENTGQVIGGGGTNTQRMVAVRGTSYLWLFYASDDGSAAARWNGVRYRRDDPFGVGAGGVLFRRIFTDFPGFYGSQKYQPGFMRAQLCGSRLLVLHALIDRDTGGGAIDGTGLLSWFGWTRLMVVSPEALGVVPAMWTDYAATVYGKLGSGAGASPDSRWTTHGTSTTDDWRADRHLLYASVPAANRLWRLNKGASPTEKWADDSLHHWICRVPAGSTTLADEAGVRVLAASSVAGNSTDVSIRLASTGDVAIYDNVAGATLDEVSVAGLGSYFQQLRWAQESDGSTYLGRLRWAGLGDQSWQGTPALTLTVGYGGLTIDQLVNHGQLSGSVGGQTVEWREVAVRGNADLGHMDFVSPDDMRGRICDPNRTYVSSGIYARWGGGGGFQGDRFDGDLLYQHGMEALFTSSPSLDWQSRTGAQARIILDADPDNGLDRWEHEGIGLFRTTDRSILVEYDTSPTFSSPVASVTVSADLVTGLTVSLVDGSVIEVSGPVTPIDAEWVGHYLHDEAGGQAVEITRQRGAQLLCGGRDLAALGFAAGNTVAIFANRALAVYPQGKVTARYMRITFPDVVAGVSQITSTGLHQLGAVVAGQTLPIAVPMDWQLPDDEEPAVTIQQSVGNLRWSYVEGEPRRTITGKVVGDATQRFRETFRGVVSSLAEYSHRPMVLVLDDEQPVPTSLLCRFVGSTEFDNEGWTRDADGTWRQVGDLAVTFSEEL